jgi:CubicO group peptidase (beta-lactamase class C family)
MPSHELFADSPRAIGLDPQKVDALFERAAREVNDGLLPSCQIAIARNGKVGAMRTFGHAVQGDDDRPTTNDTLYTIFSCTKAIMSAAAWLLIGEGKLDVRERAAEIVPEFGSNGKDVVTVEQLLLHTAGFPNAPYAQNEWMDRAKRLERFAKWRPEFPPGSRFFYHPTASFWVIAEIIERRAGMDFRRFVRERIALPLGLPGMYLGLAPELHHRVADLVYVGEPLSPDEMRKLGFPPMPETEVTEQMVLGFNTAAVREAGVPGGGGIMTAAELALFYQGVMHNRGKDGHPLWKP